MITSPKRLKSVVCRVRQGCILSPQINLIGEHNYIMCSVPRYLLTGELGGSACKMVPVRRLFRVEEVSALYGISSHLSQLNQPHVYRQIVA